MNTGLFFEPVTIQVVAGSQSLLELREPREIRGRFRHGIGLQTPMSQDGHCCGSPRWEGGGEVETRSPDIAPAALVRIGPSTRGHARDGSG